MGVHLRLRFEGANPHPRLEPFQRLETHVSYFLGNDPAKWHADVPVWAGVRYVDLYPGIDLEVGGGLGGCAWWPGPVRMGLLRSLQACGGCGWWWRGRRL
ncbi:MAG: hypothetical protein C4299_04200 [Thermoleophilia bacterium]